MFDVDELCDLAGKAARADVAFVDDTALMDTAVRLEAAIDLLRAASCAVLASLEVRGATIEDCGLVTGSWLARAASQPRSACRSRVRYSTALHRDFPALAEALAAGRVGWAHVTVILDATTVRIRDEMVEACPLFISWATDGSCRSFDLWARQVRHAANLLDVDGGHDPNDDVDANRLRLSPLPDGTRELSGTLVGAGAISVEQTLEKIADELFAKFSADHDLEPSVEVPSRRTLRALALVEACARALAVDLESTRPANVEATVVIDTDEAGNVVTTTSDGSHIPASTAEQLLVDPEIRRLLMDPAGTPLDVGRKVRLATPAQRLALAVRDGGCIHPGCDAPPAWTRIHHVKHWKDGGTTDLALLAPACAHHHTIWHLPGWDLVPDPDRPGEFLLTTPTGNTLHTERNTRPRRGFPSSTSQPDP